MRTPSPPISRLDLPHRWPTGFISGFPIDYSPALLLMPFGFHLGIFYLMDTLPSGVPPAVALAPPWLFQLSPSCPFRRLHTFCLLRPARHYPRLLDMAPLI